MNRFDIELLYAYDRWANQRILEGVSVLTLEQFTKDLGGSFRSIRDTLAHILGGNWIWLCYWKNPPATENDLSALQSARARRFSPDEFPDAAALRTRWAEIEKEQQDFLTQLTDEMLHQPLPFRGGRISLGYLMQHVANHSTYHRGQVALMMQQMGMQPPATDFHTYIFEARPGV